MPETETQNPPAETAEQKLDRMIEILDQMNKRDRLRMTGSIISRIISLIPVFIIIAAAIYVYFFGDELIRMIAEESAKAAVKIAPSPDIMEQLQNILPGITIQRS